MSVKYQVKVIGPFDVLDPQGNSIKPKGRKDCALIALLALSPSHRQSRKWLQDHLWSDRGEAQGAASLRQALVQLRATFSSTPEVVISDRTNIELNPEYITFDHLDTLQAATGNLELLQGMDVRDPVFDEWLRLERQAFADETAQTSPASLRTATPPAPRPSCRLVFEAPIVTGGSQWMCDFSEMLVDEMINAAQTLEFRRQIDRRTQVDLPFSMLTAEPTDVRIQIRLSLVGSTTIASLTGVDWTGSILWHFREEIDRSQNANLSHQVYRLSHVFACFLIERECALASQTRDLTSLTAHSCAMFYGVFVPGSRNVETMVSSAQVATELNTSGVVQALCATVEVIKFGEQLTSDIDDPHETMQRFASALRTDPSNGLVNALFGHASSFFMGNPANGLPRTEAAVKLSPNNALCWTLHALSLAYAQRTAEADATARVAWHLSKNTLLAPFVDSVCCFTSLLNRKYMDAIRFGESSMEILPMFRPTALDLGAAYAGVDATERARDLLSIIKQRDPEMCLEKLNSSEYPLITSQHRSILIDGLGKLGLQ